MTKTKSIETKLIEELHAEASVQSGLSRFLLQKIDSEHLLYQHLISEAIEAKRRVEKEVPMPSWILGMSPHYTQEYINIMNADAQSFKKIATLKIAIKDSSTPGLRVSFQLLKTD